MAKKKFTKFERLGLVVGAVVIVIFFYQKLFYNSASKKYKGIYKDWVKISGEVGNLRIKTAGGRFKREIRKLNSKLEKESEKLGEAEGRLPESEDVSELLPLIIQTASRCGLTVKSFNPVSGEKFENTESNKFYRREFYALTLNSNFTYLELFLKEISAFPRLVSIEEIDMQKRDKNEPLNVTLTLVFDMMESRNE